MKFLAKIFGSGDSAFLNKTKPQVAKINALETEYSGLALEDFPKKTASFKGRLKEGETLDDLLPEAFALCREATKRTLNQRHYDVQLVGGIALHERKIAEMKTGEGKTLVATLPVYLNALSGRGVHVVTVNDYLSRRDAVWMGQIYSLLGLSVGVINDLNASYLYDPAHQDKDEQRDDVAAFKVIYEFLRPSTRKQAYAADITYGTNHQFGFDYLRDNLATSIEHVVQREHYYAIVDEVDSILIDESRTPLIISSERAESEDLYKKFAQIAASLEKETHYAVDEKLRAITLNDAGITRAEELLGISNIYTEKGIKYVHHLETAVRASALFLRDKDYVVKDGEVVIVDSFTGRLQPGRRWSEGLHQAIEAKENVKIQKETRAAASITFQNYFRLYEKIAGMTGTAKTSEEEFLKVYNLPVVTIPTHRPIQRIDHNDFIFQNEKGKWAAIVQKVKELIQRGQPVLIGTVSIEKNEMLSAYLSQAGIKHIVLNAKNHEREGEIIAEAGKKSAVTIATNMAGRGVDIKLGGPSATKEEAEAIKAAGGLFVIGTERHEARRIDNQLRGRAGRQGDPGATQFFVSLEDDLMRVFGGEGLKKMMGRFGIPEDQPIENRFVSKAIESSQEKIEGFHFDSRKHTLEYDDVMNHQRQVVYGRRRKMLSGDKAEAKRILEEFMEGDEEIKKIAEEKRRAVGEESFWEIVRRVILYVNDILWTEHIETMEYLRSSVNLRAYGQRDPLVEYKKEGLRLFKEMEMSLRGQVLELVKTIDVKAVPKVEREEVPELKEAHKEPGQFEDEKVGRNDLCPCGSGKKFKKCHGK